MHIRAVSLQLSHVFMVRSTQNAKISTLSFILFLFMDYSADHQQAASRAGASAEEFSLLERV